MTVTDNSMSSMLSSLIESLSTTASTLRDNEDSFTSQPDGISLLDVKNNLLLSYLQNLAFLILFKLRNISESEDGAQGLQQSVVKKLVELRVYLEKGVRPLEGKLKYQIDSVLRAVENAEAYEGTTGKPSKMKAAANGHDDETAASDSDDDGSEDSDAVPAPPTTSTSPVPASSNNSPALNPPLPLHLQSHPDPHPRKTASTNPPASPRPPCPPDPDLRTRQPRKQRSQIMNEYIDEELSSTPFAQPSIGSNATILQGGRSGMSLKDREKEKERTEYEEKHFTRLPGESKAERRKARARGRGSRGMSLVGRIGVGLGGWGRG